MRQMFSAAELAETDNPFASASGISYCSTSATTGELTASPGVYTIFGAIHVRLSVGNASCQ